MKLFFLVLGMVLILEGLPYAAAPEKMRAWLIKLAEVPPNVLRVVGLSSLLIGLMLCWLVQKTSFFM